MSGLERFYNTTGVIVLSLIRERYGAHEVLKNTFCVGFGFCEYADPESTLRALRLLHNLKLGEKALVVSIK